MIKKIFAVSLRGAGGGELNQLAHKKIMITLISYDKLTILNI